MTIRQFHRWIGLSVAIYLVFQSLTGILLLYRVELQDLFSETVSNLTNMEQSVSVQTALESIQVGYPSAVIERIDFPASKKSTYIVHISENEDTGTKLVSVDPRSGQVQSAPAIVSIFAILVELHHELAIGTPGKYIVGTLGILLLAASLSGAWLWWPGTKRIRKSLKVVIKGGGVRAYFTLHRTIGVAILAFILVTSSTGLTMAYGQLLRPLFGVSFEPEPAATEPPASSGTSESTDVLLKNVRNALPNAGIRDIRFQNSPNRISRILLYREGDRDWTRGPYQQAWVDPETGRLSGTLSSSDHTAGQSFFLWLFPVHTSLGLGKFGELFVTLGGLGILLLSITGPILWWKKRKLRAKAD